MTILFGNNDEAKYTVYDKHLYDEYKKRYLHYCDKSIEDAIKSYLRSEGLQTERALPFFKKYTFNISANKWDKIKKRKVVLIKKSEKNEEFIFEDLLKKYNFTPNIKGVLGEVFHDKDNRKKYITKAKIVTKGIFSKSWIKKSIVIEVEDDEEVLEDFLNGEIDYIRIGWYDVWKVVPNARDKEAYQKWVNEIEDCLDKCTKLLGIKEYEITYEGDWDDGEILLTLK